MNKQVDKLHALSLAGHFNAPDGYTGYFGWLCGYSADAPFLNDALTRFTRLTTTQRAVQGRIFLAMMLDAGNPPILPTDVPGVAHLLLKKGQPFRLLHAKVALLGFRHQTESDLWQLRLLVSTGNWTRQTVEESLDLVWRLDVTQEVCAKKAKAGCGQDCADIKAAWNLLQWLQGYVDTRLINASPGESRLARQWVEQCLDACSSAARGEPRFCDSREAPLLEILLEKLEKQQARPKREYLALGSGFYEGTGGHKNELVPLHILRRLKQKNLLAENAEVDVFVNPDACQALASPAALKSLKREFVSVRPAATPATVFGAQSAARTLHAKFLFSAAKNSDRFHHSWLYLGSGNLTRPGFLLGMSSSGGNMEAGVLLFPPEDLYRSLEDADAQKILTNRLPVQWNTKIGTADILSSGPGKEEQRDIFFTPPVACLFWDDDRRTLHAEDPCRKSLSVLDPQGKACRVISAGTFVWKDARPSIVCIRWDEDGQSREAHVPVVDRWGRVAVRELPTLDTEEAWWQLDAFPLPPEQDDEDLMDGGESEDPGPGGHGNDRRGSAVPEVAYPVRRMMELLENIAARQTGVGENDWQLWCLRLEQTLIQARDCAPVAYFRDVLGLDPLYPLFQSCFRPPFAEDRCSTCSKRYEESLREVRKSWKVDGLPGLGEER